MSLKSPHSTGKIDHALDQRDNNFNLLRFGAALGVILSHSVILSGDTENNLAWILGYMSVNCFFIISGFLVCRSILLRNSLRHYFLARILRIYPALVVCVLVCIFLVGLPITTLSTAEFLGHPAVHSYWLNNSTLISGEVRVSLPGVFSHNPVISQVNAPLWTLQYEIAAYIALALIYLVSRLIPGQKSETRLEKHLLYLVIGVAGVSMCGFLWNVTSSSPQIGALYSALRFSAMFFSGVLLYLVRNKLSLNIKVLVGVILISLISTASRESFVIVTYTVMSYLLIYLAIVPAGWIRKFNCLGDYSYGLYIYAFPVQQTLMHYYPSLSATSLFACAFCVTLPLAAASWQWIEKPALKRKRQTPIPGQQQSDDGNRYRENG